MVLAAIEVVAGLILVFFFLPITDYTAASKTLIRAPLDHVRQKYLLK